MRTAVVAIRRQQADAYGAVHAGLHRLGYFTRDAEKGADETPCDLLVTWNLHGWRWLLAEEHRAAGATVLVAENGYCGTDESGGPMLALARDGHNGSGLWPHKDGPAAPRGRWLALNLDVAPWRRSGAGHLLVCGQRGIGSPEMASPRGWAEATAARLKAESPGRPVRLRPHPGRDVPTVSLADDLAGAAACVVWSSNCAVAALLAGVPVYYAAPTCIVAPAATPLDGPGGLVGNPPLDDVARDRCLCRLAWAQWSAGEIASGEAFDALLALA